MDVLHHRCAGMDISKRDAKVCIRAPGTRAGSYTKEVTVHGAMHHDIVVLRDYLVVNQVTLVVMEATRDYWKPFCLEEDLNLMLVNARHAKNLPGRTTDVSDAQWLAELGAHGLVRGSLIPPWQIQHLRDLATHASPSEQGLAPTPKPSGDLTVRKVACLHLILRSGIILGMGIEVDMRYFAAAADAAGAEKEKVTVERGTTIADLRTTVGELHGAEMARVIALCSFLVQGQAAEPETVIPSGEDVRVDVLPPFAGG